MIKLFAVFVLSALFALSFSTALTTLSAQEFSSGITTIQSDQATYNGHELHLNGNVIVENSMGKVFADRAILRRDQQNLSKIDFPWLEIKDHVEVHLSDGRLLTCTQVNLDYITLTGFFTSDSENKVYYRDQVGEIYSEAIKVEFASINDSYKPKKITLMKHVQLINRSPTSSTTDSPSMQYALADQVDYFPQEDVMYLQAFDQKRVLFFDQQKNMQLSAKSIKAKRDVSGQETIQGIGDVRFTFAQDELEKLKDRFHLN